MPLLLRKLTPLKLIMPYPVSISAAQIGERIRWDVADDVVVDGITLVPKGAEATANVTTIFNAGTRPRLSVALENLHLPNGEIGPICAEMDGNRFLNFFTTPSNDAVIADGTEIQAYLASDVVIKPTQGVPPDGGADAAGIVLRDSTPVSLKFVRIVTSENAQAGDRVAFRVVEPIVVDSFVAIPKGSIAWGTVTEAETSRNYGHHGRIAIRLDFVRLANGEKASLTATTEADGKGKGKETRGTMPFSAVAAGVVAAVTNGSDVLIPEGKEITAYVKGDVVVRLPKLQR